MDRFVDTNILIYAEDLDAGPKQAAASRLVSELWMDKSGVISIQVLQELFVNLTRKVAKPIRNARAAEIIDEYLTWRVVPNTPEVLRQAIAFTERYSMSFWDASIVAAATTAGCTTLYSEDLQDGQVVEGCRITNPFRGR